MKNKENIENLSGNDAIKKLQELVNAQSICHFVSNLNKVPLNTRPMATMEVDENGNFWFFSARSSDKNTAIELNNTVQLFYSNISSSEYLSVYGKASIILDDEKAQKLWTPLAKAWFKDGVDDIELTLIRVTPFEAYYWDTKNNKVISMLKIFASMVTGITSDDGIKGKLKV
jgi:general stress protein 26